MPAWITAGFELYAKRLPQDYRLTLCEISAEKRTKHADLLKIMTNEEKKIRATIPKEAHWIVLDRTGKSIDTQTLAQSLQTWHDNQETVCFVIGGPEGLSDQLIRSAPQVWSLSGLTLPHPLVRVILAEQLYRAWSIVVNHPYHR